MIGAAGSNERRGRKKGGRKCKGAKGRSKDKSQGAGLNTAAWKNS